MTETKATPATAKRGPKVQTSEARFWSKVQKSSGCWMWTGAKYRTGYGSFWDGQKSRKAHRFSWALVNGPIPEGKFICHQCDVPLCVNPAHLFLGDCLSNIRDMDSKKRRVVVPSLGEKNGSAKLVASQVLFIKGSSRTARSLADEFGVSDMTILKIRKGYRWKTV